MDIIGIPASDFPRAAHAMMWHFESFVDRSNGEATLEGLFRDVMNEHRQCWVANDGKVKAVGLTQVLTDSIRVVEFTHCAGEDWKDWGEDMVKEITAWAKHIGADRVRIINRPGYTKMLKGMGFRETHRVLEQDIE